MDVAIMTWVNGFVGVSPSFDSFAGLFLGNPVVKGLPIGAIFLYLWFRRCPEIKTRRAMLLATIVVSAAAIAIGRILAKILPFRLRPVQSDLGLTIEPGIDPADFDGWSSLPSDHAVLFFALAASFWMISRGAGLLMTAQAVVAVAFTRVYFSLHWPSDIVSGALVGVLVALLLMRPLQRLVEKTHLFELGERYPQWLHPLLFAILFQITTMFNSARAFLIRIVELAP